MRVSLLFAIAMMMVSCDKPTPSPDDINEPSLVEVESISLSQTSLSLTVGDIETLTAVVAPEDATDKTVTWSTSDASIVTVESGKITAVSSGIATVTAKAGSKEANCTIVVKDIVVPVTSISLDLTTLEMIVGETAEIITYVLPENATDVDIDWTSSDDNVATVENGVIMAIAKGLATITASIGDVIATCEVTVLNDI